MAENYATKPHVIVRSPRGNVGREVSKEVKERDDLILCVESTKCEEPNNHYGIDFTNSSVAMGNLKNWCDRGIPVVEGTTGIDYKEAKSIIEHSKNPCVIGPNMAMHVVLFQNMVEHLVKNFGNAFQYFDEVKIAESHQASKIDTSGTALYMKDIFKQGGAKDINIESIRNEHEQLYLGIPEEYINAHAHHEYELNFEDGSLKFSHTIYGRKPYVSGTMKALEFLIFINYCRNNKKDSVFLKDPKGNELYGYNMLDVMNYHMNLS